MADILFLQKILLALFVGALLGLEREYTKKQTILGVRTFAMASLLGALAVILGDQLGVGYIMVAIGFGIIGFFALLFYVNALIKHKIRGFTTNFALILAYMLGVFVGFGLFVEAIFLSIIIAVILFSRERLHTLVGHLNEKEVGDLMEFLILLGIVYPLIPQDFSFLGINFPLLTIWYLTVFISLINFAAFVASRYVSAKEEFWALSFLGGLVSTTATLASLINFGKKNRSIRKMLGPSYMVTAAACMIRNFGFVLITVPYTISALLPILIGGAGFLIVSSFFLIKKTKRMGKIRMESPFNVAQAVKLGLVFLVLFVVMSQAQKVGAEYFALAAIIGGAVNTTAVSISLITLLLSGSIAMPVVGFGLILANLGAVAADYVYASANKSPEIFRSAKYMAAAFVIMYAILTYLG